MRYLGNKTKLIPFIQDVIKKHNIKGKIFIDLFAGTGSVGDYFKETYTVIANDFMYYSYVLNQAKLLNTCIPQFDKFKKKYDANIFDWLNSLDYEATEHFFIYNNYTPIGNRMFFTVENGVKIDGIRITIEDLYKKDLVSINEYYFLIASLLECVTKVSNTSGTYEAFFKFWESRSSKEMIFEPLEITHSVVSNDNKVFQADSNTLIRDIDGDILYIDPPYTVTQYASAYHVLETIARYDLPSIKGIGGKRDRGDCVSLYSRKKHALEQFEDLFRQSRCRHMLISYSNQSIIPIDELVELAKMFSVDNNVYVNEVNYSEYKNHRQSRKRKEESLKEFILYFEKRINIMKSPLNYSGSKDKLVHRIIKELPKNVGTFVDVMGGAFNVGANISALNKVVYNDSNVMICDMIEWLIKNDKSKIVSIVEERIEEFKLEKGNKEQYLKLRDHYNQHPTTDLLYVLHMYSFQNMIRFNNNGLFNTPSGVAGYSNEMKNRILNFSPLCKNLQFMNLCYTEIDWASYPLDTIFYFDPPYFITTAAYNDGKRGSNGWNADMEVELLNILTRLNEAGYKFLLSNVLHHKSKTNNFLQKWVEEHNFKKINIGISGWRYSKNEVLIKNY